MVWAKLDDQFPQHRKVWPRSDAAFRLHVAGICHSSWLLLNGEIEAGRVPGLVPQFKRRALDELLSAGLWHGHGHDCPDCEDPPEGAYIIHDYLAVNPSDAKVKADREARADRQRRWRERKAADVARNASRDASRNPHPEPDPTRPGPKGLGSGCGATSSVDTKTTVAEGDERPDTSLPTETVELARERLRLLRGEAS